MKPHDYMNAPRNDEVLRDSKPVNAARECTFLQAQLESLETTHKDMEDHGGPASEMWCAYDQAFKRILGPGK